MIVFNDLHLSKHKDFNIVKDPSTVSSDSQLQKRPSSMTSTDGGKEIFVIDEQLSKQSSPIETSESFNFISISDLQ